MSNVVVITHGQFEVNRWFPAIKEGLRSMQARGIEGVHVLGDGVPGAKSWVNGDERKNSGLTFKVVNTDWSAKLDFIRRNEELLENAEYVVVLGHIATTSAANVLARAFQNPKLHAVQVLEDGTMERVGRANVKVASEKYALPEVKPAAPRETESWSEFMAPAKPTKAKK